MIPISDDNPGRRPPFITWAIVAGCVAGYVWQVSQPASTEDAAILKLAFVPAALFDLNYVSQPGAISPYLALLASLFLHGGLLHLGGNMLYLWIFGNNVEDAMGHARFVGFYLVSGVIASLTHAFMDPTSTVPLVGASGAISGVLAAYLLIYPRARVTVIVPLGILLYPMKISAFFVIGFWFLLQVLSAAMAAPGDPGVAWWAHVGGFGAGLLLTPILSRFPLFGRGYTEIGRAHV